jgi:hypothetical protein
MSVSSLQVKRCIERATTEIEIAQSIIRTWMTNDFKRLTLAQLESMRTILESLTIELEDED